MAPEPQAASAPIVRRRLRVRGQVQGVGYRPFVYREARGLGLSGWVCNDAEGVLIEAQGSADALDALSRRLKSAAPPLARVDRVDEHSVESLPDTVGFAISESRAGRAATGIAPDAAVCPQCLRELFDPNDRRYRYPFVNCTHCGPRYTITRAVPYDRPNTSMAGFVMCDDCRGEYEDPGNRRFHAQPNACAVCGPRLKWLDGDGRESAVGDIVSAAVQLLREGGILALKGLGGFHLVCDARQPEAVARLRKRKHREDKPFAVMAANGASLVAVVDISDEERRVLESPERPVVLLSKRDGCDETLPGVSPGLTAVGAMLPYTPLHFLLFHEAVGRPAGMGWLDAPHPLLLVMTSANPGGEPLVVDNAEAVQRLRGIADAFVVHDRDIVVRCDDSVIQVAGGAIRFLRRARGYTPGAIRLPAAGPAVLATGAGLKVTVCLTRKDEAFVSQHIGDLDNASNCRFLEETAAHLLKTLDVKPAAVAHDMHPDLFSSRFAASLADRLGVPAIPVQHHFAHVAAVAAEHGLAGPFIGVALDGIGYGSDGSPWGGELLAVDGGGWERVGRLRRLPLPGADRAAKEPWRMAVAVLREMGREREAIRRFPGAATEMVIEMLERGVNAPLTSSAGRWFDAAAALLGVRGTAAYEGQVAMLLEALAAGGRAESIRDGFRIGEDGTLDLLPVFERLLAVREAAEGAALFHLTMAEGLASWTLREAARRRTRTVVLSGGCFLNRLLSAALRARLEAGSVDVYEARQVPPGDGGVSLGQAWVAMQQMAASGQG